MTRTKQQRKRKQTAKGDATKSKQSKQENIEPVAHKTRGFLISHDNVIQPEKVVIEAASILNEYAQKKLLKYKSDGESCRFVQKNLQLIGMKNRVFMESDIDDPHTLVYDIFTDLMTSQVRKTQSCLRFQPVFVCSNDIDDIIATVEPPLASLVSRSDDSGPVKYKINWIVGKGATGLDEIQIKKFEDTINNTLPLGQFEQFKSFLVDLMFEIRVESDICFVSVLENFHKFSKYNINSVIQTKGNVGTKTATAATVEAAFNHGFLINKMDNKTNDEAVVAEAVKILQHYTNKDLKKYRAGENVPKYASQFMNVENFVFVTADVGDPRVLVNDIYADILTSEEPDLEVTHCKSILPVWTCKRKFGAIVSKVKELIKPIFVEQGEEETLKYKISCKGYFPEKLNKTEISDALTTYLTSEVAHTVSEANPDVAIRIQNVGQVSYISVLPKHDIFKGYNLAALIESRKPVPEEDSEDSEEGQSDDDDEEDEEDHRNEENENENENENADREESSDSSDEDY